MAGKIRDLNKYGGVGLLSLGYSLGIGLSGAMGVSAQIIPDTTVGTIVTGSPHFTITGGTRPANGPNLFHSFNQFSVPTGGSASFNNAADVVNIISRVTGSSVSTIDGLLQANGNANLFLINPAGIVFGPNASLNLGGSFLGSTATSLKFADATEFSAANPTSPPLLTITAPVGLQMGQNPASIQVVGTGHRLAGGTSVLAPYQPYAPYPGLQVQPNQTLALLAGDLNFTGAVLQAPGGRIDLGSVTQPGLIPLQMGSQGQGFSLSYPGITSFGAIHLSQRSSLEVRGFSSGNIQIQGGQVNIQDGSLISGTNFGAQLPGTIAVSATRQLALTGMDPAFNVLTGIIEDSFASGIGGNIVIQTPDLLVQSGAAIFSRNYGAVPGGTVKVLADRAVITGYVPNAPDVFTRVGSLTTSTGRGGDVFFSGKTLIIQDGGFIGSVNVLNGIRGGDVLVNADTIEVQGISPKNISSIIGAVNLGIAGQSGNLTINTQTLAARTGGLLATSSINSGNAGNVLVTASKSIEIIGVSNNTAYPTTISSTVSPSPPIYQQLFGLPVTPSGTSGNVVIKTPWLTISDCGIIGVSNDGIGGAGSLSLQVGKLLLKNEGAVRAAAASGNGGNIMIQADSLVMLNNAAISTTAYGSDNLGSGGNINLASSVIVGANNSDIVANAVRGQGGNIHITTQGIFGLQYQPNLTPQNDITASSEYGVNGTVDISIVGVDPIKGLNQFLVVLPDPNTRITATCDPNTKNMLTMTGRGGLPPDPTKTLIATGNYVWTDLRLLPSTQPSELPPDHPSQQSLFPRTTPTTPMVEISRWALNSQGEIALLTDTPSGWEMGFLEPRCGKTASY